MLRVLRRVKRCGEYPPDHRLTPRHEHHCATHTNGTCGHGRGNKRGALVSGSPDDRFTFGKRRGTQR